MAKYWTSGQVKTRLGTSLGMDVAASLHRLLVLHLCRVLTGEPVESDGRQFVVSLSPDARQRQFAAELSSAGCSRWNVIPQGDGDLGQRMARWFSKYLTDADGKAILIGADCPTVTRCTLEQATSALDDHDVVIGPALDGGYYLIGLRGRAATDSPIQNLYRPLFETIPWSTSEVFEITRERCRESGLAVATLDPQEDIDTIAEFNRFRLWLASAGSEFEDLRTGVEQLVHEPPVDLT